MTKLATLLSKLSTKSFSYLCVSSNFAYGSNFTPKLLFIAVNNIFLLFLGVKGV